MKLSLFHITPALTPYVKVISCIENDAINGNHSFRILPDTCVEIFFNWTDNAVATIKNKTVFKYTGSFASFRMNTFADVDMLPGTRCIAVCFYPGAAHYFFNTPMHALTNATIQLDNLWKNSIQEVQERLAGCANNNERVSFLQQYLLQLLSKKSHSYNELDYCLWQINLFKGQLPVKTLSQKTNISQRQLARQFNNLVGLSPKEFARINRFLASLQLLKKYPQQSLTQIAYESGYYDQAHFIHDYCEFAGVTPGKLLTANNVIY